MSDLQDAAARDYLRRQYAGVFDESSIDFHLRNHVGFGFAEGVLPKVAQRVPVGGKLLDVGAGFGSFVIAARRVGLDAVGIEIASYEVEYARRRIATESPGIDPASIFHLGDGRELPFADNSFDAVTLWNVLEHVPDARCLLAQVAHVLKPGGLVYIICPNYASFRPEAHYQVFWFSLMPRAIAGLYLKWCGKDPAFFKNNIFYRTNWEVLSALRQTGLRIEVPSSITRPAPISIIPSLRAKLEHPDSIVDPNKRAVIKIIKYFHLTGVFHLWPWCADRMRMLRYRLKRLGAVCACYNPFKHSIVLCAQKEIN